MAATVLVAIPALSIAMIFASMLALIRLHDVSSRAVGPHCIERQGLAGDGGENARAGSCGKKRVLVLRSGSPLGIGKSKGSPVKVRSSASTIFARHVVDLRAQATSSFHPPRRLIDLDTSQPPAALLGGHTNRLAERRSLYLPGQMLPP
jgi:hypothetical protein